MTSKAKVPFHATDPVTGERSFYKVGDTVPDNIAATVGDHAVTNKPEAEVDEEITVKRSEYEAAVEAKVAEQVGELRFTADDVDQAVETALTEYREQIDADERLRVLDDGTVQIVEKHEGDPDAEPIGDDPDAGAGFPADGSEGQPGLEQPEPEFDPTAEGVTAQKVYDYLDALDTDTAEGQAEFDRVAAAEKAGENRKTAIPKR